MYCYPLSAATDPFFRYRRSGRWRALRARSESLTGVIRALEASGKKRRLQGAIVEKARVLRELSALEKELDG